MMLTVITAKPSCKVVKTVKSVSFDYRASPDLASLMEDFQMCNDAIRIASNGIDLIEMSYPRLKSCGFHTHYILSACEVTYSVYRNRNRKSTPYVRRPFLKVDFLILQKSAEVCGVRLGVQ